MCAIAGFFNHKTKKQASEENLVRVLESMRYRGPDHLGTFVDRDIAMGNCRLAILGISSEGNQPIYNEDGSIAAVYNGEIYNFPELKAYLEGKGHVFYSKTDTEVLVHLYEERGDSMANELNGMFAFALFDIKQRILILCRDRSGQKPLYINRNRDGVFFASELKAMLPYLDKHSLNPLAIRTFLSIGYALEPETIINEVRTVEPGTLNRFGYGLEDVKRFWMPSRNAEAPVDINEWIEKANSIFKKAVRRHLLSDVPITLFLSGGVDSSLIALYLKDEGRIKKAYSGSFVDQSDHDEFDFASNLGEHCGFEVERVRLSKRVLSDDMEGFLSKASSPQGDYSGLASYCMAKVISKEYKVILGGDGGDELFGGYPTYALPYLLKRWFFIPKAFIDAAHRVSTLFCDKHRYMSLPFRLQQLRLLWGEDTLKAHFMAKNFLPDALASRMLKEPFIKSNKDAEAFFRNLYDDLHFKDQVKKLCWVDFNTFLRSATIPKVERTTMAFSLEARLPYLDNEVVEFGLATDASLMLKGMETKVCLKSLLKEKLNGKVALNLRKQGFSPPLALMFEKELKEWKEHWLNFKTPFFTDESPSVLRKWRLNGWDLHRLEWNICVLSDWCFRNRLI